MIRISNTDLFDPEKAAILDEMKVESARHKGYMNSVALAHVHELVRHGMKIEKLEGFDDRRDQADVAWLEPLRHGFNPRYIDSREQVHDFNDWLIEADRLQLKVKFYYNE